MGCADVTMASTAARLGLAVPHTSHSAARNIIESPVNHSSRALPATHCNSTASGEFPCIHAPIVAEDAILTVFPQSMIRLCGFAQGAQPPRLTLITKKFARFAIGSHIRGVMKRPTFAASPEIGKNNQACNCRICAPQRGKSIPLNCRYR